MSPDVTLSHSLAFLFLGPFPKHALFSRTWTLLSNTGQVFRDCSSGGICLLFFFLIRLGYWYWGNKSVEVKFYSPNIRSRLQIIRVIHRCWGSPGSPGWGAVCQAFPLRSYYFPHAHHELGQGALCATHTRGERGYAPRLRGQSTYAHFLGFYCMADLSVLCHAFILKITCYISRNLWTLIIKLGYEPILVCLFCSNHSSFGLCILFHPGLTSPSHTPLRGFLCSSFY